ncbi:MAG: RecX family transcriptional regulator [Anaerolineae bacterium]
MGTITALQRQRRRRDRVSVFIDDEYAFSLALEVAATLRRGQELTDADIERLTERDEYASALDRSMRYLSYRPRSRREIERYLDEREVPPPTRDAVLERLMDLGLVDDEAFAGWWVRNRSEHKPRGALALRSELVECGVPDRIIGGALAGLDEDALATRLALAQGERYAGLPREQFDRRLGGYLSRRGFRYEAVRSALARAWRQVSEG